jgi:predicted anti-sigma-YlaC factor YlaD
MSEHELMRELLALGAAESLDPEQQRRLDDHAGDCPECRHQLQVWSAYAEGLRRLPQPAAPSHLLERTRARVMQEQASAADRRWNDLMLGALALFAWTVGLSFWLLLRVFTGGALVIMGANLLRLGTWSALSTVLVWLTAAAAALALGRRRRELRRAL